MDAVVEQSIDAGVDSVWKLVSDLTRWDHMLPTMQQVTRSDAEGPIGVGARFEVRQPGLPKAVYEITEWEPGSGFTWVSSSPGVRTTATHRLRAEQGRTRLTLGITWAGPLSGIVRVVFGAKTRRMVRQEADTFASLAEEGRGDDAGRA
jgi:ligand-binding SRPBCC domain-containing protein